ncbi:HD-GYP domain-containing protein [Pseudoalteromonas sp. JBTF-M23]|uniref:HD-GYP domain-containing protein n=1 Tax=Pseudoalteromonas caenipelagi TaxID=2726988 RepID=A0A849VLC0_9GAMM|nr:HD-GYP domain-containing protein [Pseudoalteromonas caenipelagi]NOU52397.1 HD-GYP domain-containing protein [Pseudoalteromonas caenipelagi]
MKTIDINELKPGMFVVGVTKQTGHVKVKNQGWVKTQDGIDNLLKAGVMAVEIDPDKTLHTSEEKQSDKSDKPVQQMESQNQASLREEQTQPVSKKYDPFHKSTSIENELDKANALYQQAKALQQKTFDDLKNGKQLDLSPFQDTASGLIDSIFRNQDALACIAQIKDKDAYLLEHSINVAILIGIFAKHLSFDRALIEQVTTGALLHDIGKIQVPDEILNKPGTLTHDEYEVMKQHARFSYDIVANANLGDMATEIAGFHHERLDGSGYPYGKSADELSQYVRMIAIVDTYDAITADRVYKSSKTPVAAFKVLREHVPHHYDETLLNAFIHCMGVYPVGTLVKLKSQRVGVISQSNPKTPLQPIVKIFYHAKHMHYTEVKDVDLSSKRADDEIEAAIKPEEFSLNLLKFFKHSMLP